MNRNVQGDSSHGVVHADLSNLSSVQQAVKLIRDSHGKIGGLIHLLPLMQMSNVDHESQAAWLSTKSLYLLAQQLQDDLNDSEKSGNTLLLAATGMGGSLGYTESGSFLDADIGESNQAVVQNGMPSPLVAAGAGVVGLAKCLALEWPEVVVRALDLDPERSVGDNVDTILAELQDTDGPIEVGNDGERRMTWEPIPAAFDLDAPHRLHLDSTSVILLTGGARGITAKIAEQLAIRFQPRLVLVGRSQISEDESEATRSITSAAELKQAIIAQHSANGKKPDPRQIEQTYQQLLKTREIRTTLDAIRAAGASVEYIAADMRDASAVQHLIQEILSNHGRLDGVIHGAGVIEDKLIADKTVESFDRVFGTKVDSTFHLARFLPHDSLKFVALFSSIASRFGNRGQSDYAAANELLTKFALQWDRHSNVRIFSVAWGPWNDVGMVADLAPYLTARGISLIPPKLGAEMFVDELLFGQKGESEIIIAGGAENLITSSMNRS